MDQINVELIKYSLEVVYEKTMYNNIAAKGKHPNEVANGILRALQKPKKPEKTNIKFSTNNFFIRA